MQQYIYEGDSISTPNDIGGVQEPSQNATLAYTTGNESAGSGPIGRYASGVYDWFGQAYTFWNSMDKYAQQHTVDGYRFELGNVGEPPVVQRFIDDTLNSIDNCLARRVAYGVGATMPAVGSGPMTNTSSNSSQYPSLYPLNTNSEPDKSLVVRHAPQHTAHFASNFDCLSHFIMRKGQALAIRSLVSISRILVPTLSHLLTPPTLSRALPLPSSPTTL
jgi:hypothetical protein